MADSALRYSFPLLTFSQELLTLLDAGMSLIEAIGILERKAKAGDARLVLERVSRQLNQGEAFSQVLEAQPDVFPILYVATVRSSERTGDLPAALRRYIAYHQQVNAVRDKVVAASIYPILLIVVSAALLVFLLFFVVPRFARIYADMGDRLPWVSRMMVEWSAVLEAHGVLVGLALLAVMAILVVPWLVPTWRAVVVQRLWRIPALGERLYTYQMARFSRTLSMLLQGGIPFVQSLGMIGDLLEQPALKQGLLRAKRDIEQGGGVSEAFRQHALGTETAVSMLAVGERTGGLGPMLEKIADMYDAEVARSLEWFSRLLEPVLMIVVGLVIGVVILMMYLPIIELVSLV